MKIHDIELQHIQCASQIQPTVIEMLTTKPKQRKKENEVNESNDDDKLRQWEELERGEIESNGDDAIEKGNIGEWKKSVCSPSAKHFRTIKLCVMEAEYATKNALCARVNCNVLSARYFAHFDGNTRYFGVNA